MRVTRRRVLFLGCAAAAAVGVYLQYGKYRKGSLTEDQILEALKEVAIAQFDNLYDLAMTASRVRANLKNRNLMDSLPEEELNELFWTEATVQSFMLLGQEALDKLGFDITVKELEDICINSNISVIIKARDAQAMMVRDAVEGKLPVIPNIKLPDFDFPTIIDLLDRQLRNKRLALDVIFGDSELMKDCVNDVIGGFVPTPEVGARIKEECAKVDRRVISESGLFSDWREENQVTIFRSVVGLCCRLEQTFEVKRNAMMERHTEQVISMTRRAQEASAVIDSPSGTERLEHGTPSPLDPATSSEAFSGEKSMEWASDDRYKENMAETEPRLTPLTPLSAE